MKKAMTVALFFAVIFAVQGCFLCPEKLDGDRLAQVNEEWWQIYNSQRCPTSIEIAEYDALDDAQKMEWRRAGNPVFKHLLDRKLDAVTDFKKAVDMEAAAAK